MANKFCKRTVTQQNFTVNSSESSTTKSKTKKKLSADKPICSEAVNCTEQATTKSKSKKISSSVEQPSSSHDIDGTEIQADTDDTEEWGGEVNNYSGRNKVLI